MERRRNLSPQCQPLLENRESETSQEDPSSPSLTARGRVKSNSQEPAKYEERVIILSDGRRRGEEGEGGGREGNNGDADSGISLSEESGERSQHNNGTTTTPTITGKSQESLLTLIVQIVIPFFFAGFGMMAAGLLLDAVQHWSVYEDIVELFILVPALLGLKGNLEMTLASRLSTAANLGHLDTRSKSWSLTWGNLALVQTQALVVATLATFFSIILGADLTFFHQMLLGASSMGAASIASAILGTIMIGVVIVSHYFHINPDNVATPIAASLGDLVTLGLLSLLAQGFYDSGSHRSSVSLPVHTGVDNASVMGIMVGNVTNVTDVPTDVVTTVVTNTTISPGSIMATSSTVVAFLTVLLPVTCLLAYKNMATRSVLFYGWFPVVSAMIISSGGGLVLSKAVSRWKGIAIYSPIINGVGGNLVAVQASRISTSLHQIGSPGQAITAPSHSYHGIHRTFFCGNIHARTARVLVLIAIPGSLVFLFVINLLRAGHTTESPLFYTGYLICALLQVVILLLVADWMVHFIWRRGYDPDNIVIPFLTALGDLLGTGLLSLGFLIMWYIGDRDEDVGE